MKLWLVFACSELAVLIYMITITLPYPAFREDQDAYRAALGTTPRVFAASLAGHLFGEFLNAVIFLKLKVLTQGKTMQKMLQ